MDGLFFGNVVDVHGDSGSAKTELMMNVVVNFLLLSENAKIAYFDNDVKLDVVRLGVLLKSKLRNLSNDRGTVTELLKRVIVFRCQNQIEFMASLFSLDARIRSGEIKLLMIDSWTAFLWDNIANRSASTINGNRLRSWFRSHLQRSKLVVFGTTNSTIKSSLKFWDRIRSCRLHLRRAKTNFVTTTTTTTTHDKTTLSSPKLDHEFEAGWSECSVKSGFVAKFCVADRGIVDDI